MHEIIYLIGLVMVVLFVLGALASKRLVIDNNKMEYGVGRLTMPVSTPYRTSAEPATI